MKFVWPNVVRWVLVLAGFCLQSVAQTALAADTSPELARGMQWLAAQVQANGSLAGEQTSVADEFQVRSEVAQTLSGFVTLPTGLVNAIAADPEISTEHLARRIVTLAASNRDASSVLSALSARQNADGGFGGAAGYQSNPLDTAWAMRALNGTISPSSAQAAIGYLQGMQNVDGSFNVTDRSDAYVSAQVLSALRPYEVPPELVPRAF